MSTLANDVKNEEHASIICFLLINEILDLPESVIRSALENSHSDIYIGYIDEQDLKGVPESNRIHFVPLKNKAMDLGVESGFYKGFDKDSFFTLVQLKWYLFQHLMEFVKPKFIIYSDLDVIWLKNPVEPLLVGFGLNPRTHIYLQDFTANPSVPRLCMGFFAFRNTEVVYNIIEAAQKLHHEMLITDPQTGDDDVITRFYSENDLPETIQKLPQSTFPVGNLLNAYSRKSLFYGIPKIDPYIFHANFVVGNRKKVQLTLIMFKQLQGKLPSSFLVKYWSAKIENYLRVLKYGFLQKIKVP